MFILHAIQADQLPQRKILEIGCKFVEVSWQRDIHVCAVLGCNLQRLSSTGVSKVFLGDGRPHSRKLAMETRSHTYESCDHGKVVIAEKEKL